MPKLTLDTLHGIEGGPFFWAIIDELNRDNDTANISRELIERFHSATPMPGDPGTVVYETYEDVPIVYHCKESASEQPNGSLEGAAGAFNVGDKVLVYDGKIIANQNLRVCKKLCIVLNFQNVYQRRRPASLQESPEVTYAGSNQCVVWDIEANCLAKIAKLDGTLLEFPCTHEELYSDIEWEHEIVGEKFFCKFDPAIDDTDCILDNKDYYVDGKWVKGSKIVANTMPNYTEEMSNDSELFDNTNQELCTHPITGEPMYITWTDVKLVETTEYVCALEDQWLNLNYLSRNVHYNDYSRNTSFSQHATGYDNRCVEIPLDGTWSHYNQKYKQSETLVSKFKDVTLDTEYEGNTDVHRTFYPDFTTTYTSSHFGNGYTASAFDPFDEAPCIRYKGYAFNSQFGMYRPFTFTGGINVEDYGDIVYYSFGSLPILSDDILPYQSFNMATFRNCVLPTTFHDACRLALQTSYEDMVEEFSPWDCENCQEHCLAKFEAECEIECAQECEEPGPTCNYCINNCMEPYEEICIRDCMYCEDDFGIFILNLHNSFVTQSKFQKNEYFRFAISADFCFGDCVP